MILTPAESATIDTLRTEFLKLLDDYNSRLFVINGPGAKPDYKCLAAFEQLFSRIKRLQTQYSSLLLNNDNVSVHKSRPRLP